jgi:hypothetical protein
MAIDQPVEIHQQVQKAQDQELRYGMPYDTRPMEGELGLGEKMAFHGGIVICNHTNRPLFIREDFLLHKGGYYVNIFDKETEELLLVSQSPMNTAYFFIQLEEGFFLEKLPPNS